MNDTQETLAPDGKGAAAGAGSEVPESQMHDNDVICPYCRYRYQAESVDFDERERREICGKCDREFLRYDEIATTHHTRPLAQNEGGQP